MDWKSTLASVAPTIASALGGPMAGVAVKAGLSIFGIENGDEKQLQAAVSGATHEQLLALKKADQDFAARMKELDIDLERIMAGDRDSARRRAIEMNDWSPIIIGAIVIVIWAALNMFILTTPTMPAVGEGVTMRVMGQIDGGVALFYAWLWGASKQGWK